MLIEISAFLSSFSPVELFIWGKMHRKCFLFITQVSAKKR